MHFWKIYFRKIHFWKKKKHFRKLHFWKIQFREIHLHWTVNAQKTSKRSFGLPSLHWGYCVLTIWSQKNICLKWSNLARKSIKIFCGQIFSIWNILGLKFTRPKLVWTEAYTALSHLPLFCKLVYVESLPAIIRVGLLQFFNWIRQPRQEELRGGCSSLRRIAGSNEELESGNFQT